MMGAAENVSRARALTAEAVRNGCQASRTSGGNVRLVTPAGLIVIGPDSRVADWRAVRNYRAKLRRAGVLS